MKCTEVQRYVLEHAGEAVGAPYQEHLRTCAECRRAQEQAESLCKLLSLKRFEQPDSGFEARNLANTMRRIRNLDSEPAAGWSLWDWLAMPHPVLRYSAAAFVAALVGVNVYLAVRSPDQGSTAAPDQIAPSRPVTAAVEAPVPQMPAAAEFAQATPTQALAPSQDVFAIAASNRENSSGGVQYGPGPSTPVNYNY